MNRRILLLLLVSVGCGTDTFTGDAGGDSASDGLASDGGGTNDGSGNSDAASDSGNEGGGIDSGPGDASTSFPCGANTCNSTTEYCQKTTAVLDGGKDGGGGEVDQCVTYPSACGSTPSCSCIPLGLCTQCKQTGADITVTCP